jgi:single-strand DNA-binding protein
MSINRVVITGNLTRDPEQRETAGGMMILKMGVAVNDRRKNPQSGEWEDAPNFFDVVMFGKRAESVSRFLSKGSRIAIDGKLRWSQWDDKETGAKRSKVEIVADDIELLSPRGEGGGGGGGNYSAPTSKTPADPVIDDDIPF